MGEDSEDIDSFEVQAGSLFLVSWCLDTGSAATCGKSGDRDKAWLV